MTDRQQKILESVISEYVKNGEPVASSFLLGKNKFDLSPATMRIEFNALEKQGYLYQPHISSGCVPTDKAYRLFVNKILSQNRIEKKVPLEKKLERQMEDNNSDEDFVRFVQKSMRVLADMSSSLAISYFEDKDMVLKEGFEEIVKMHEFEQTSILRNFMQTINNFEGEMDDFCKEADCLETDQDILVYIGKEITFNNASDFSILVSRWESNKDRKKGAIALIGPKRMEYDKNISLMKSAKKLIESRKK